MATLTPVAGRVAFDCDYDELDELLELNHVHQTVREGVRAAAAAIEDVAAWTRVAVVIDARPGTLSMSVKRGGN